MFKLIGYLIGAAPMLYDVLPNSTVPDWLKVGGLGVMGALKTFTHIKEKRAKGAPVFDSAEADTKVNKMRRP